MEITGITTTAMAQMQMRADEIKTQSSFQDSLNLAVENQDKAKLRKACVDFESYFIHQMFKEMRKSIPSDGIIPKGHAEKIFEDMLDEEVAKSIAEGRGVGLADMMYKQMQANFSEEQAD